MLTVEAPSQTKELVHCQHVCGTLRAPMGFVTAEDKQTSKPATGLQGVASAQTLDPGTNVQARGAVACPKEGHATEISVAKRKALAVVMAT